jgi:hypothetical protein
VGRGEPGPETIFTDCDARLLPPLLDASPSTSSHEILLCRRTPGISTIIRIDDFPGRPNHAGTTSCRKWFACSSLRALLRDAFPTLINSRVRRRCMQFYRSVEKPNSTFAR